MANLTDFFFDNGQKVTPLPDVSDQLFLFLLEVLDPLTQFIVLFFQCLDSVMHVSL